MAGRAGVVVVHFGDPTPTHACIARLHAEASPVEREIVVVDNSDNVGAGGFSGARVLRCPDNPGFGGGANRGVAALGDGPWDALVVLNHDIAVHSGFLAGAVAALAEPRVGAAAGPLYFGSSTGLWYAGGVVSFPTGTVWQSRSPRAARIARDVGFLPGAALAIAPAAWRATGGFDPAYFLYNEDLDLCLRLRRRGFRLRFQPSMAATHHLGAATGSARHSPLYLEHMARTRLRPFRPTAYRAYLSVLHSGYVVLRAAWHATLGSGGREAARALLRGHLYALRHIGEGPVVVRVSGLRSSPE